MKPVNLIDLIDANGPNSSYVRAQMSKDMDDLALAGDDEIIVDIFCGGGGAATGLEMGLGRNVSVGINHNAAALSMHAANHPFAEHYQQDIREVDPIEACGGKKVGWLHASPDCTHHSQASGGQPRKKEIRDLSWVVIRWAGKVKPRVISLENVKQIQKWGPLIAKRDKLTGRVVKLDGTVASPGEVVPVNEQYLVPNKKKQGRSWRKLLKALVELGYDVDYWVMKNCNYGDPTTRERLYLVSRRDGVKPVKPEETHAEVANGRLKPWRTAAECIDWSDLGRSIFDRPKPLADATMRRIAKGIQREVIGRKKPFMVPIANWSRDVINKVDAPLPTITAWPKGGSFALTTAFLAQMNGGFNTTHSRKVDAPISAITRTGSQQPLVAVSLVQLRNNCDARPVDEPLRTLSAGGLHHGLVSCVLGPETEDKALRVSAFLLQYYSEGGQWGSLDKPLNSVTTKDRMALVTVWIGGSPYVIVDIKLRMLKPSELFLCQGFPEKYVIANGHDGRRFTLAEQTFFVGNSVSPGTMAAIARANNPWRAMNERQDAA